MNLIFVIPQFSKGTVNSESKKSHNQWSALSQIKETVPGTYIVCYFSLTFDDHILLVLIGQQIHFA